MLLYGGLPIFADASLVSAVHGDGTAWAQANLQDGIALHRARRVHEQTYPELCHSDRAVFVMLGSELGGRLSPEALSVLRKLSVFVLQNSSNVPYYLSGILDG